MLSDWTNLARDAVSHLEAIRRLLNELVELSKGRRDA